MKAGKNTVILLLVLLVGLVLGGIIGELLQKTMPILGYGKSIGFQPVLIDLGVIRMTLGIILQINLASVLGLVLAVLLYKKL